jgi:hypothetical protein
MAEITAPQETRNKITVLHVDVPLSPDNSSPIQLESLRSEIITLTERILDLDKEVQRQAWLLKNELQSVNYSNAFYMGAGLSAFAGIVGYLYFGGYVGLLSIVAASGPFLMSILGLIRSRS